MRGAQASYLTPLCMKGNIHDLPAAGPDDATQPGDEGEEMSEEEDDDEYVY